MTDLDLPVIDLRGPADSVAASIGSACADVGFFLVVGHGVDSSVVEAAWSETRAFFDAPLEHRLTAARRHPDDAYGYIPLEVESLHRSMGNDATPPDLKQTFNAGPHRLPARPLVDDGERWAFAPTPWPSSPVGFRPALEAYLDAMLALADRLMSCFARALGLPDDHFASSIDESPSALRVIDYPHQDRPPLPGQLRAGAHTDYGTLTVLRQDAAPGGLEVLDPRTSQWLPVPALTDSFVINLGDLMSQWTNDRWRSTLHRVVNPAPDHAGSTRRQSIAFFHNANYRATIECLPTCLQPGESPRHPPVEAGPHLMSKFHRTVGRDTVTR